MSKAIGIWDPQANSLQVWRLYKLHRFQKDKAGSNKAFTLLASRKGGHWITEISLDEYGTRSKSLSLENTSHIIIKKHNKHRNGCSATYEITSSMNFYSTRDIILRKSSMHPITSPDLLLIKSSVRKDCMNSFHTWENFIIVVVSDICSCQRDGCSDQNCLGALLLIRANMEIR